MTTVQKEHKSKKGILVILLLSLIGLWVLNNIVPATKCFWYIGLGVVGFIFSIKNRSNTRSDVIVGIILSGLVCLTNPFSGIATFFAYIGAQSVFRKSHNKIVVVNQKDIKNIIQTMLLVILIGGVLGLVNVSMGFQSMPTNLNNDFKWVIVALSPGIGEEVVFRFILFAICVVMTGDKVLTKWENILCYGIIVIPHVLLHFQLNNIDIGSVVMLTVLFGAPFAVLQRKWNLVAAMGSHYLVDLIRFFVFAG